MKKFSFSPWVGVYGIRGGIRPGGSPAYGVVVGGRTPASVPRPNFVVVRWWMLVVMWCEGYGDLWDGEGGGFPSFSTLCPLTRFRVGGRDWVRSVVFGLASLLLLTG